MTIIDDFSIYEALRSKGATAAEAYASAKANGADNPTCIRMLRAVYELPFAEAKEVSLVARDLATSLDAHQAEIADELEDL